MACSGNPADHASLCWKKGLEKCTVGHQLQKATISVYKMYKLLNKETFVFLSGKRFIPFTILHINKNMHKNMNKHTQTFHSNSNNSILCVG